MLTLGARHLPVETPVFWSAIAACAVKGLSLRVRADLAYSLETGVAGFQRTSLRDLAELIIRDALPYVDRQHCRAECVLAIVALDIVPAAGRAWRVALLAELESCDGK